MHTQTKLQWLRLGSKMSLLIVKAALALSFSPPLFRGFPTSRQRDNGYMMANKPKPINLPFRQISRSRKTSLFHTVHPAALSLIPTTT